MTADDLRSLAIEVRNAFGSRPGVVALVGGSDEARPDRRDDRRRPRRSARRPAPWSASEPLALGGRGGGRDDLAQGGGSDAAAAPAALTAISDGPGRLSVRIGVRLALDWGKARIGVAASDPGGILAHPVETVPAGPGALPRISALVAEYEPFEVVLGLPRNLAGVEGPAAIAMREVADHPGRCAARRADPAGR